MHITYFLQLKLCSQRHGFMEINMMSLPVPVALWPKTAGTKEGREFFVLCFQP